jgi:hypothetical protein
MVEQYPHYLCALSSEAATQNDDGDFVSESDAQYTLVSMCREETNGRGSKLEVGDGTFVVFTSLIQLPKGSASVEVGQKVAVFDDAAFTSLRVSGECLKFDNGQLHNRLWL